MNTLDAKDLNNINKALKGLTAPLLPVFETIGQSLIQVYKLGFRQGVAPDGSPWQSLSAIYQKQKKQNKNQILVLNGILRNSLSSKASNTGLQVGTNIEYGPMHQFGLTGTINVPAHTRVITQAFGKPLASPKTVEVKAHSKKIKVPARPFIGITSKQVNLILSRIQQHYQKQSKGSIDV